MAMKCSRFWMGALAVACGALFVHSAGAQESPAKVGTGKAQVHQFGIVRTGLPGELLDLPEFVHGIPPMAVSIPSVLDFSALYFHPPLMMEGPLTFQVRTWIEGGVLANPGIPEAWYPYAQRVPGKSGYEWSNVLVGVQADGLETTHPQWMVARAMESAATLKVYKPGPAGSKPDDEGTTEGDVFIFLRSQFNDLPMDSIIAKSNQLGFRMNSQTHFLNGKVITQKPMNESNRWAWLAENGPADQIISRSVDLQSSGAMEAVLTTASVTAGVHSTSTLDLRSQLNEAITGNGLRPDEAAAQAELVLQSVAKAKGPVLIYFLTQEWVDAFYPLEIEGPAEKPVRVWIVINDLPTSPDSAG